MVTLFVFWFTFTVGLRQGKPIEGYPYFLWLETGLLPWFYMRDMITVGSGCIRKYKHLVTKMKFPISIIPTFVSISHLLTHLGLVLITIVLFMGFGYMPDIYLLQLPLYTLMMFIFFTVWAIFAGLLSAVSKDFLNLVNALVSAVFWMSGVIFNVNNIESHFIRELYKFNPVTICANGYRYTFIYKKWFFESPMELAGYCFTMVIFVLLALWAYRKLRKEIPDVL